MKTKIYNSRINLFSFLFLTMISKIFAQVSISETFTSGGAERWYIGAMPNNPEPNLKLVILFCGSQENAYEMESRAFHNYLENNTMVVYPQPFDFVAGFDNTNNIDDFQMVEDLITDVASNYNIDTENIFIGGFSNGGSFTYNLVCEYNNPASERPYTFKAIAVVSGFMNANNVNLNDCPIVGQVPLIAFHGTGDQVANYNGGTNQFINFTTAPTETIIDFWANNVNGCNNNPTVTVMPDLVTETQVSSFPELLDYNCSCSNNTKLYRIVNGAHAWPSGGAQFDFFQNANMDIVASELIADFFECNATLSTNNLELNTDVSIYPNPVKDVLHINTIFKVENIEIFDMKGQLLESSNKPTQTISLENLNAGIYLLIVQTDVGSIIKKIVKL